MPFKALDYYLVRDLLTDEERLIQDTVRYPLLKIFPNTTAFGVVLIASCLLIFMIWLIAWILDKKKIYLTL